MEKWKQNFSHIELIKMIIWTNIINRKYVNVINLIQPGINCSTIQKKLFIQHCCRPKWQSHVNFSEIEMDNFLVIKISFSSSTPKSPFWSYSEFSNVFFICRTFWWSEREDVKRRYVRGGVEREQWSEGDEKTKERWSEEERMIKMREAIAWEMPLTFLL